MVESVHTETAADRAGALERSVEATKHLSEDTQKQAINAVLGGLEAPSQRTANWLWRAVIVGLTVVLVIALIGVVIVDVRSKTPDTLVTVFTATLTGLVGLFVPSPMGDKGSSSSGTSTPTGSGDTPPKATG